MPASPFRRPLGGGRARILLLLALLAGAIGLLTLPPAAAQSTAVTLSANPTTVTEGSSVTVTVTLASAPTSAVSIPITLTDGSAESTDHGALTTITVAANATTGTGTITTAQDTDAQDEKFTVALGTLPTGYTSGTPSPVTITIEDDEQKATASLSAASTSVTEGSNYTVTVTLSAPVAEPPLILLDLTHDSSETTDTNFSGNANFQAGETSADVSGTAEQDTDTQDEKFTVSIDTGGLAEWGLVAGAVASVTITILDDDPKPTVELKATPNPVLEGHMVTFTVTLSAAASQDVTIPLSPDTAATAYLAAADVTSLRTGVPFRTGQTDRSTLVIIPQDADALDETFTVSIDTAKLGELGYAAGSVTSVAVTVEDDERFWFVNLSASPEPVPEGSPVTVTATLSRPAAADVAIPLTLTDTAIDRRLLAESDDYDASSLSPITISAGETTGTATIVTYQDAEAADDYFNVVLDTLPTDYRRDGQTAEVQIRIADDEQFALQINYGDTELLIGPHGGISSTDTTHYVEASPTMRSLTLTPTWPEARMGITVSASVRYTMHALDGTTLTWGVLDRSQSRKLNMYSPLGSPGYPLLTFTVGSDTYKIVFHNNGAWEFHQNNLLATLKMILGR